ncbi:hypothetical protein BDV10DRAFT_42471 [Aspergillus recurvatus]
MRPDEDEDEDEDENERGDDRTGQQFPLTTFISSMRSTILSFPFLSPSFLLALALVSPVETGLISCPFLHFHISFCSARRYSVPIPMFLNFFASFHVSMCRVGLLAGVTALTLFIVIIEVGMQQYTYSTLMHYSLADVNRRMLNRPDTGIIFDLKPSITT